MCFCIWSTHKKNVTPINIVDLSADVLITGQSFLYTHLNSSACTQCLIPFVVLLKPIKVI